MYGIFFARCAAPGRGKGRKKTKKDGAGGEVAGGVHGASRLGTVAVIDALTFGMIAGEQFAAMKK